MYDTGAQNAAALFAALAGATILVRLAVAAGLTQPTKPFWAYGVAAAGLLLYAAGPQSTWSLVTGSAVVGAAQGLAIPACSHQVSQHVARAHRRAAMAVWTISLDVGFILVGAGLGPVAAHVGLRAVFVIAACACAVAAVSAYLAGHRLRDARQSKEEEKHAATQ